MKTESARTAARNYAKRMRSEGRKTEAGRRYLLIRKLAKVKKRAKLLGVPFDLDGEMVMPLRCPVLGIPLDYSDLDHTPSFDRIDQGGGYTKENVRVVSMRANTLRGNANWGELLDVALDAVRLRFGPDRHAWCVEAIETLLCL